MIDQADLSAIHDLIALYGHVIDERQWSHLGELFTDDVVYDASDLNDRTTYSLVDLHAWWSDPETRHPLAHHTTNVVVFEDDDETVRVVSKGIGVGYEGRVGSAVYRDVVVRTPVGWRIAVRVVTLRRPDAIPDPS